MLSADTAQLLCPLERKPSIVTKYKHATELLLAFANIAQQQGGAQARRATVKSTLCSCHVKLTRCCISSCTSEEHLTTTQGHELEHELKRHPLPLLHQDAAAIETSCDPHR